MSESPRGFPSLETTDASSGPVNPEFDGASHALRNLFQAIRRISTCVHERNNSPLSDQDSKTLEEKAVAMEVMAWVVRETVLVANDGQ